MEVLLVHLSVESVELVELGYPFRPKCNVADLRITILLCTVQCEINTAPSGRQYQRHLVDRCQVKFIT